MAKHGGKKNAWKNVAVALGVGGGAVLVTMVLAPKVPQLQAYPYLVPGAMVLGGGLLAARGRVAAGIGLAGGGGAVAAIQYGPQIMQKLNPAAQPAPQSAGTGWQQAGAMGGRDSGWYDRPALGAGAMYGRDSHAIRESQGTGWQNAGALGGRRSDQVLESQGIGDDGIDDDD